MMDWATWMDEIKLCSLNVDVAYARYVYVVEPSSE